MNFTVKGHSRPVSYTKVSPKDMNTMYLSTNKPYSFRFFPKAVESKEDTTVIGFSYLLKK